MVEAPTRPVLKMAVLVRAADRLVPGAKGAVELQEMGDRQEQVEQQERVEWAQEGPGAAQWGMNP